MRSILPLTGIISFALVACDADASRGRVGSDRERESPSPRESLPALERIAESKPLPYSINVAITLVSETRACVIASYDIRVLCGDREWTNPLIVGSRGDGPGEFQRPLDVIRGPAESFAVVDNALNRMTVFSPSGELRKTTPIPSRFHAIGSFDTTVVATYPASAASSPSLQLAVLSLTNGAIRGNTLLPHPMDRGIDIEGPNGLGRGVRTHDGDLLFKTGIREIVRYSAAGDLLEVFAMEGYEVEYPSERDIVAYRESAPSFYGGPYPETMVDRYASQPKPYTVPGRSRAVDDYGRLWVATQRDRDQYSYLDLYAGRDFLGSLQVRDRLLGFDLYGSVIAVLVERSEKDADGLPLRAIDWYRASDD